ncbi:acyltransferase domain-containing protein [Pseudonocardia spinosispora]|uniref:acyltransferase domain-containing protein n=1 Tax=Pseudonocardia spinosispora TaxID=103441 RepID=UPI0004003808|nr:acyltransferase domain-containing protein [Pseudonocardia spinosispora]
MISTDGGAYLRDGSELGEALDQLRIFGDDRRELIATLPRSPRPCELVEETAQAVLHTLGRRAMTPRLRPSPSDSGAAGRYFYAHVCLALLPHVLAYHRERAIPSDVSWATLESLAINLARHRRIHGHGGLEGPEWVVTVFRGLAFRIGRFTFERDFLGPELATALAGHSAADALSVHVPVTGPLPPEECSLALSNARRFLTRHFPEDSSRIAHCRSWLLDPQLAEYLPADSDIIRFAARFHLVPDAANGDRAILDWVLETSDPRLPEPATFLQRAVVGHLREGRHWRIRLGWIPLPTSIR